MALIDEVRDAIENGDPTDNELIELASREGNVEAMRLLLEDGRADPSAENNYALIQSSISGNTEIVRLLLEDGRADPRIQYGENDNRAIQVAARNNNSGIVRLLLEDGRTNPSVNNDYVIKSVVDKYRSDGSNEDDHENIMLLLEWYGNNSIPIERIINIIPDEYRKYILMYYDLNEIPLDKYNFNIRETDQEFVEYMLTNLAYDTKRKKRFLKLINPVGYNLQRAGIPSRGVRDIISEYAGINPEVKTNYNISQTLDDIGIPPELTSLIGSLLIGGQRRSDTELDVGQRRAGAGAGSEYPDSDSD